MSFVYTDNHLIKIRHNPHLLGHIVGKDKLTDMHSKWINYVWDSRVHRGLQGHRGSYKTTAITIIGCIWWLLFHPNDRIAIVRKTSTDAQDVIQTISTMFDLPEIQALFLFAHGILPKKVIDRGTKLLLNFKGTNTPESSIDGYGVGTELTGKHYDKIICDDIVTIEDRYSKAERDKTKYVLQEIVTNIIDPGKQVIHTGTPWHRDDAWSLIQTIPESLKYDVYSTGILNAVEIKDKRKTTTEVMFAANYELKHIVDTDSLFNEPTYTQWDYTVDKNVKGQIDAKYDGTDTNGLTFMYKKSDGRYQGFGYSFPENIKDKLSFVLEKYRKHRCSEIYCETNADKGFLADKLKEMGMRAKTYSENMNKHLKITTYLVYMWENIDWDIHTDSEYMRQIMDYREGLGKDDSPDSASSLCRVMKETTKNLGVW